MPEPTFMQRLLREKALSRYLAALERGDIDAIIAILHQSSQDAILEQMIFELHETYQTEEAFLAMVQEEHEMDFKEGIHKSLPQEELDELQAAQGMPTPEPKRYARWLQALAAILLIVLLSGGVLFYTRLHSPGSQTANSSLYHWCTTYGAALPAPLFLGITAIAPDDVWLIGQNQLPEQSPALLEHWNGQTWSLVHDVTSNGSLANITSAGLSALDALSANDIWAVGSAGTVPKQATGISVEGLLVEHWNGQTWQVMPVPTTLISEDAWFSAVSATSDTNMWAAGGAYTVKHDATSASSSQNLIMHWDGSHWSTPQLPAWMRNGSLTSIKTFTPNDVWVTGLMGQTVDTGKPLLAHWDGQSWTEASLPDNLSSIYGRFDHLTALSASDMWASGSTYAGQTPAPVILHWNGSKWTQIASPTVAHGNIFLGALKETGPNSLWAIGNVKENNSGQMLVEHWDGRNWSIKLQQSSQAPDGGVKSLNGIAVSGSKVWVIVSTYQPKSYVKPFIETTC